MNRKQMFDYFRKATFLLSMFMSVIVFAQQKTVTGTVYADGSPLPGASVMAKDTKVGTATDFDGKFSLNIASNVTKLVVSYMGYVTQEVDVTSSPMEITLQASVNMMDEVVVTALGIKREQKALGYATQNIDGDAIRKVQSIDMATALTGKVAGLLVQNPSDFNATPTITILGEKPLLVIDGIPYVNKTLNDIASEDIENIDILKGGPAAALYGSYGGSGAILVTTKNGSKSALGMSVDLSSSSMFTAGFLAIPEKQILYGRGENNTYQQSKDQSWGGLMDGSIKNQWDPIAKVFRDYEYLPVGKDNFNNFLEQGYLINNNLSVAFNQTDLSLRSSINWTQNKGRYPNSQLDKYSYTFGGDVKFNKFQLSSNLSFARRYTPNMGSNGYTSYDPMYTLMLNSSADFDVLDYKDNYWIYPGLVQNNHFGYDYNNVTNPYSGKDQNNPYYDRYERLNEATRNIFNADITMNYDLTKWLKVTLRSGIDYYGDTGELKLSKGSYTSLGDTGLPYFTYRYGLSFNGRLIGAYLVGKTSGLSSNSDLLLSGNQKFANDKFEVEYLAGSSIIYQNDENINALTVGGISVPGFFSLAASVSPATVAEERRARQTNSAFGRIGLSWNKLIYIDLTGRNDWSSTLAGPTVDKSNRSYFYPSISGSFIVSELLKGSTKVWLDLFKIRGSWAQYKKPADPYAINSVYTSASSIWNATNGTYAPNTLYDINNLLPSSYNTKEIGLQGIMLKKRLTADITYYNRLSYDAITKGELSAASGYNYSFINTEEERTKKGWLIALKGTPIKKEKLQWDLEVNWSTYKEVYSKLDPTYSPKRPWVKVGERVDPYLMNKFKTVPSGEFAGQYVFESGLYKKENFSSVIGYQNPDWIWGLNTTFKYNNWSLFASLDGVKGGMIKSVTENYMWIQGVHPDSTTPERALDVATPGSANYLANGVVVISGTYVTDANTGEVITDTRIFGPNTTYVTYKDYIRSLHTGTQWGGAGTEADILDGTFFKLREVSLTYQLPNSILESIGGIKNASLSLIGQNVFLWSKDFRFSDPDAGGNTENLSDPSSRYIGANIKLSF